MSTIDTSTWNPDADLNIEIEGIPLNADAGIAQTWKAIAILMAALKGDTSAIQALMVPFTGATSQEDGSQGFVPAPEAGDEDKFLKGDGTWDVLVDSNAVHKTGDETISGSKYFSSPPGANRFFYARHLGVKLGDTVTEDTTAGFLVLGSDGYRMAEVEYAYRADGSVDVKLAARKNVSQSSDRVQIRLGYDANGNPYTYAPTPAVADDSSKIATTQWVRDATGNFACNAATATKATQDASGNVITSTYAVDSGVVHKTGDEIIAGTKTFSNTVKSTTDGTWRHIQHSDLEKGTNPSSQKLFWDVFADKKGITADNNSFVTRAIIIRTSGECVYRINVARNVKENSWSIFEVVHKADGTKYATCPSTPATGNNNDIITRDFIASDSRIVHTTGDESVSGVKTLGSELIRNGVFVKSNAAAGTVTLLGGVSGNSASGAKLDICGASHSSYPGGFRLQPGKTGAYKQMILLPDGTATWDGQAIQTSSDERLKTPLSAVPDAVLDAWGDVQWGQYQYLEAVAEKGDSARLHLGLIAQRVKATFEARGLDACEYGILCHDVREATEDEPAVDLWTVRYAEALAMEAAFQRRRADRLEARIVALEEALK